MSTKVCIFNPTTNLIDVTNGVSVYSGSSADAGAPVILNSSGALDASFLNANPLVATAAVTLPAGSLVNLYYATLGSPPVTAIYARLANAAQASSLPAMGFVSSDYNAGDTAIISTQGLVNVPFVSGFAPSDIGAAVYLSTTAPGGVTKTTPTAPDLIQPLGYVYQVGGTSNSFVQFPFLSFPLATVNQTPIATSSVLGVVKPDNTTITVSGGTITAVTGTTSVFGILKPDGTTVHVSGGVISVPTATTGALGLVKPDGTTITVSSGTISATGFLPLSGGTLGGNLTVNGNITLQGATSGSFVKADGTGYKVLSSSDLSDKNNLVNGTGTVGYIAMYSAQDSPPLSPPTLTNIIGDSHLDDGLTTPGVITSTEPVFVQGGVTAAYLAPFIIYSAAGTPLPTPSVSYLGVQAVVSDATAPTYMGAYVSGGTITCAVICSINTAGSPPTYAWLTH